ncbi:RagB/SusD family nutrient uptake outer membrane protein [Bacteroides ovatus]|uniref:RagB/SusD family nutrient uptake outer membrane protein n=1 Tax=Bacteroides ovatus TaxID=28116 RepID=UPI0031450F48
MIKIKGIIAVSILLFAITSCSDFLDIPPVNLLSSDGFYQSPSQSEQGILGIYANLRQLACDEYLYMSECRSDNTWVTPEINREYGEIATFRAGDEVATFNTVWNTWYKVIYDANVAIAKIPDCNFNNNDSMKDQFLGEAHFLRGWAYFELSRLFGNIPLIDIPMSPAEVKNVPQSTSREIIDKIVIPDLTTAKSKLPLSKDMVDSKNSLIPKNGRADRIAAQAMLARVYMTLWGFPYNDSSAQSLAETELKAVITFSESNNDKYWAPDSTEWRKQWMPAEEYYNKYSIFAIQYRSGGTGNPAIFYFGPKMPPSYTSFAQFGNEIFLEKSMMYEFDKTYQIDGKTLRDARGIDYSVLTGYEAEPNNPAYSNIIDKLKLPDGSEVDVFTRTMFYKYLPSKRKIEALGFSMDVETGMKDYLDWPVNLPIIRYEDILLMYAEILTTKDIGEAMKIVNRIRKRAGCAPETAQNAEEALSFIKRERRIELLGEGVRWFDLIRWNEWQSAITGMFDSYNNPQATDKNNVKNGRYLYPIPLNQMNVKPGLYKQNEGY